MSTKHKLIEFCKELFAFRSTLIFLLTPLLLLPLPLVIKTEAAKCGYVLILMAIYWTSEALPLPVTSLIPIILFPFMGIMKAKDLSLLYFKDTNVMLIGGLLIAVCIETSELHKRVALKVLSIVGGKPKWLMLGFMLPTWFLSMWISNTAATAMMLPVAQAVISELEKTPDDHKEIIDGKKEKESSVEMTEVNSKDTKEDPTQEVFTVKPIISTKESDQNITTVLPPVENVEKVVTYRSTNSSLDLLSNMEQSKSSFTLNTEIDTSGMESDRKKKFKNTCAGLVLCIAFAANVGGTATVNGTGPNLIMKGAIESIYERHGLQSPVTFASWMALCLPASTIMVILIWFWLQILFFGFRESVFMSCKKNKFADEKQEASVRKLINEEVKKLGPIRFNEVAATIFFLLLVFAWFFREPGFMPGWAKIFKPGYTSGSTPAILIGVILFFFPSKMPTFLCLRRKGDESPRGPVPALLDWKTFNRKMPWDVVLLLGGGFCLAKGVKDSGLGQWIGDQLTVFKHLPGWAMVLILCIIVAFLTQITSNSATATILMPIMASLAENIGKNPLYLMFPVAVSTSFAFMLPVATPPNAIVFSSGNVKTSEMARAGFILNFVCVAVITLAVHTWGMAIFDFNTIPWATSTMTPNITSSPMLNASRSYIS